MFIASVREGRYDPTSARCSAGSLGTWAIGIEEYFLLQDELESALADKLKSLNRHERLYVLETFFRRLPSWRQSDAWLIAEAVHTRLQAGDEEVRNAMKIASWKSTPQWWREEFAEALRVFVAVPEASSELTDDDIPL